VRVVNVVDVMRLFPVEHHPHGTTEAKFVELFTPNKPVFFAFGKYQRAIHEMVHGHPDVDRIHVRGFNQQGTITTPFQMVVMNEMSCFPLAAEAIRLVPHLRDCTPALLAECEARIAEATAYAHEHFEDQPEIRDRVWTD
jgi:xylulose-5-phosphate/fructose-6-phosphate phosphoketolase